MKKNFSLPRSYIGEKKKNKLKYVTYICISFLKQNIKMDNTEYVDSQNMSLDSCIQI